MKWAGVTSLLGSASSKDRAISLTFEPTCNLCGIDSGYKGQGSKTVLPRRATTKIDFRLVPNQDPDDILAKLRKHLQDHDFGTIEIQVYSSEKPAKSDIDSNIVEAITVSAQTVYGQTPNIWPSMPGTGPMTLFVDELGIQCSMGVGVEHTGSGYHAPNENISIVDFTKGMKHAAALMLTF
jgi:acetylornithine deacetylase/succinyl-diaminopimelate desuccinylase-like protein